MARNWVDHYIYTYIYIFIRIYIYTLNHYSSTILKVDFLGFEPSCWPASPPRGPSADGTTHVTNAWDMTKNTPTKIIDLAAENGDIKTYTPIFKVSPKLHVKKRPSFSCQPPNLPWNSVVFRKIQPVLPSFVLCIS